MKRSFLHLTLLGLLGAGSSCSRDPARLQALTDKLSELEERGEELKREVITQRKAVEAISSERERLVMDRAKMGEDSRKLLASIQGTESEFAKYKADYRRAIQERAKGIELGNVTVEDGQILQRVVVSSASNTELTVIHANGMAKIPLSKAPAHIQDLFGFDDTVEPSSESDRSTNQLDRAIRSGKQNLLVNKERLEKIARDSRLKTPPAPSAPYDDNQPAWKKSNTFEGSFYAPIKGKSQGAPQSKSKVNSNMGKPL